MANEEPKILIENPLQQEWLRYLFLMIETNTIHCSQEELDTFYRVWVSERYSQEDSIILNDLLRKHPLKKLKNIENAPQSNINFGTKTN